jgi:superfamily I DNA/RNA helicase
MDPEILKDLDPDQKESVCSPARHMLVVSGPGSGKTRVLASRFAYLVKNGIAPESILAVTFTNRAALEMKKRVLMLLTRFNSSALAIGTFHSFSLKFLKRERPGFSLYARGEQVSVLKELGVKNPEKALEGISAAKNLLFSSPPGSPESLKTPSEDGILEAYQQALTEKNALDLDDLIVETIRLLEDEPGKLGSVRSRFRHVLVDEYQDINPPQAYLVKILCGGSDGAGLFAIGDPDQSIYSFRGANLRGFFEFKGKYPEGEVRTLGRNYRSTGVIVKASRALVEKNQSSMDRTYLRPVRDEGPAISVVDCPDERAEAEFVVKQIESLMGGLTSLTVGGPRGGGEGGYKGFSFSDFAVLVRTNRQTRAIEEVFKKSSVPYQVVGPPPELHGFTEYIRGKGLPAEMKLSFFIEAEGRAFGLEPALLSSLVHTALSLFDAMDNKAGLEAFVEHLVLIQPADAFDIEADRVAVMTMHMAKGLEFPVVFISGVEEGIVPLKMKRRETDVEEERRLFYVGMTRAREKLFLINAQKRRLWGETLEQKKSPFLKELPEVCIKEVTLERKKTRRRPVQKGLFE